MDQVEKFSIWPIAGYDQIDYTKLDSLGNPIIAKMRVSPANVFSYWPGIGVDSFANVHLAYRADSGPADRLAYTKLDRSGNTAAAIFQDMKVVIRCRYDNLVFPVAVDVTDHR